MNEGAHRRPQADWGNHRRIGAPTGGRPYKPFVGRIKELEQEIEVGKGKDEREVEAKYRGKDNQTTIKVDEPKPETKIIRSGLVLLRMATDKGKLIIEF
jgi:hypothetical protein